MPNRPKPLPAAPPPRLANPSASAVSNVEDATGIGQSGGPALSDTHLISEVIARGLQSAFATDPSVHAGEHTFEAQEPELRPLRQLAVSVRTAAEMLGVGISSVWSIIAELQLDVFHPVPGRTVVTVASLERFVATRSARSQLPQRMTEAPIAEARLPIQQEAHSANLRVKQHHALVRAQTASPVRHWSRSPRNEKAAKANPPPIRRYRCVRFRS
jgi:hypothetical protein